MAEKASVKISGNYNNNTQIVSWGCLDTKKILSLLNIMTGKLFFIKLYSIIVILLFSNKFDCLINHDIILIKQNIIID